ncbi:MAG: AAA family ATPase [Deltaproteobacteria bacterium HGW-Deltaproteobacteria-19]|jgi:putative ATPase|nr:MAG: AAA family ATPase [Deltaproteobacteria bacterium HGW-Deltaproteobacteria-19]
MMDLFERDETGISGRPLAERMRPHTLEQYFGQEHVIGPDTLLRRAIGQDRLFSMILWGPPGSGKTTLARILAGETKSHFISFSAVLSGVKEIRAVIEEARRMRQLGRQTILFVDEIHRFNKAQQDAFLPHVESGLITLVGATTENPSFEVIAPLLSRCRVLVLKPLLEGSLVRLLRRAIDDPDQGLGSMNLQIEDSALEILARFADGDARAALNGLEAVAAFLSSEEGGDGEAVTPERIGQILQRKSLLYDKEGEEHYNLISALHKSLRDSDPDASLYWLARMLAAGEDPLYVARRMIRFASEDIGNADPRALSLAIDALQAYHFLGSPEGELVLAQAVLYLATAPKSNAAYIAFGRIQAEIRRTGSLPVPLHIRNAPTRLMKDLGYGDGYQYAHDYEDAVVFQEHLPEELQGKRFYNPTDRGYEKMIGERLAWWRKRLQEEKGRHKKEEEA